ncbi:DUF5381 family protein [Bacillus sp. SJS]|uniref:DUF5381 family protein n=1 Tax=Bacillus sp. SJS TaxID=1423321 RepID=UPI0012E78B91|nr:DUF5381 family protein [Bacillus sp. SJS]
MKGNPRLIRIGLIVSIFVILFCAWLAFDAVTSGLTTSLLGFLGGLAGLFFGFYFLIRSSPVFFNKNKVLLKIITGPEGRVESDKKSIPLKEIKDVSIQYKGLTLRSWLYYDIVITDKQNNKIRIPTYNVLDEQEFKPYKESYILPYIHSASAVNNES